jgi:hypothetical protein
MIRIYLDQQIYQGIKHKTNDIYENIQSIIKNNKDKIIVPYSIAHLSDLSRSQDGSEVNKELLKDDLILISEISDNNILIQNSNDWSALPTKIEPIEYYNRIYNKPSSNDNFTLEELFSCGDPVLDGLFKTTLNSLKQIPSTVQKNVFNDLDAYDSGHFIDSKKDNNLYNFLNGLNQIIHSKKNPGGKIYLKLRNQNIVNQGIKTHGTAWENPFEYIEELLQKEYNFGIQKYIESKTNSIIRENQKPSLLHYFHQYYLLLDEFGFKKDQRFPNLMDDAAHSYFGAHCDVFVTNDNNTYHKSKAVYDYLNLSTKVCFPEELEQIIHPNVETHLFDQLISTLEKSKVLLPSLDENLNPIRIYEIEEPYLHYFNRLQTSNYGNDWKLELYKKHDTYAYGSLFQDEIKMMITKLINEFGSDLKGLKGLNIDTEIKLIQNGNWQGRSWNLTNTIELNLYYSEDFGLVIRILN